VRALLLAGLVGLLLVPPAARGEDDDGLGSDDEDRRGRLFLGGWGGQAFDTSGTKGRDLNTLAGEVGWSFPSGLELSAYGAGYRQLRAKGSGFGPVTLARITERFSHRGLEAGITLGAGAARTTGWQAWFQFGFNARLDLGPMFIAGELAFEQDNLLHLSGGIGVRLF
jgi:hypothetical protein